MPSNHHGIASLELPFGRATLRPMAQLRLTKLDAARRLLETAVDLYFRNGDPVSIETLTALAEQIIEDVAKRRNTSALSKDFIAQYVTPEKRGSAKTLREPRNVLKHADPDEEMIFTPDLNEAHLFLTCMSYRMLTHEKKRRLATIIVWVAINNPGIIPEDQLDKKTIELFRNKPTSKEEYYKMRQGVQ